jgi:hypothetical protein
MKTDNNIAFATEEQELLLQASLLEGEDAINAWEKWENAVDLEGHPDNGSYRLFPLLYKNLEKNGIKHPFMNRLRGIYRQAWYKNQRLFYDMSKVLELLHKAGIRTMVLKGAALTILCYKNYAVRPMADVDVLVHPSQAMFTVDLLEKAGWMPLTEVKEEDLYYSHSRQFNDSSGKEFDLHWHPVWEANRENNDADCWIGAVPLTLANVSTLAPSSTDNLLHTIIHGIRYNHEPPIRWIADAVTLINSSDMKIDWEYFINQTRKHRVALRTREALIYLQDKFKLPVSYSVMDKIRNIPVSRAELIEYQQIATHPDNRDYSLICFLEHYISEYRRIRGTSGIFSTIAGLPEFLQWRFNKKNYYQLCSHIISRSIIWTGKRFFSRPTSHHSIR